MGIGRRREEQWAVVTVLALVAPDKLEKEDYTHSIKPGPRLSLGTVNFVIAAVRTALPSNFKHNATPFSSLLCSDYRRLGRPLAFLFRGIVRRVFFFLLWPSLAQ
jgi:hypothetical protein